MKTHSHVTKISENIARVLTMETYMKNSNDIKVVHTWVEVNPKSVFYYKETMKDNVPGELNGKNMPLQLVSKWQRKKMLKHGHRRGIAMDATFETNHNKVCAFPIFLIFYKQIVAVGK